MMIVVAGGSPAVANQTLPECRSNAPPFQACRRAGLRGGLFKVGSEGHRRIVHRLQAQKGVSRGFRVTGPNVDVKQVRGVGGGWGGGMLPASPHPDPRQAMPSFKLCRPPTHTPCSPSTAQPLEQIPEEQLKRDILLFHHHECGDLARKVADASNGNVQLGRITWKCVDPCDGGTAPSGLHGFRAGCSGVEGCPRVTRSCKCRRPHKHASTPPPSPGGPPRQTVPGWLPKAAGGRRGEGAEQARRLPRQLPRPR